MRNFALVSSLWEQALPALPSAAGSIMELLDGTDIRIGEALFPRRE